MHLRVSVIRALATTRRLGIRLGIVGRAGRTPRPLMQRRVAPGRSRDRRTGHGGAGAAAPTRPPPGYPRSLTVSQPRQAAWATAVRAITRSARMPSTSNAAHSAAIRRNSLSGNATASTSRRAEAIRRASSASLGRVALRESIRVGLVVHPLPNDLCPNVDVPRRVHVDGQPEPVQQLRAQLAFFRVHRADQHEPGLVRMRDPIALNMHPPHRGGIQQQDRRGGRAADSPRRHRARRRGPGLANPVRMRVRRRATPAADPVSRSPGPRWRRSAARPDERRRGPDH